MPDGFKYDLELETAKFEQPAKAAAKTAEQSGQKIETAMKEAAKATENLTDWMEKAKQEGAEAGRKIAEGMDRVEKSSRKAETGINSLAKAGLAMQGIAQIGGPIVEGLEKISPAAGKAGEAVMSVANAAAGGFAVGGPWGAAITGGIALVTELASAIDLTGGAAERNAKAAADAEQMVIRKKQEHLQLLKDLGKAAADNESARQAMERQRAQANSTDAAGRNEFAGAKAALALEARRIAAGALSGKEAVTTNQQIDKDAVDQKYGSRQNSLEGSAASAQREVDRVLRDKQAFERQLANTPANDDKRRAELAGDLEATEKALAPLQKAAKDAAIELEDFKRRSAELAAAEKKNIDAKAGLDLKSVEKKEEDAKFKKHDEARKTAVAAANDRDKKAEDEAKKKQGALTKQRETLEREVIGLTGADAESPRAGRGPSAGRVPGRIKGAISQNTFGPRQITDRMRETGDLRQRARKFAESKDESPATAKQVETLQLILRELKKSNAKPATP